jgi:hypothetical protein
MRERMGVFPEREKAVSFIPRGSKTLLRYVGGLPLTPHDLGGPRTPRR